MNTDKEKKVTPDLDEEALMNLMVDGVRKEGLTFAAEEKPARKAEQERLVREPEKEKSVKRERSRSKEIGQPDYEEIFFREVKSIARHGKSVYIDPDHHKKLSRIVQVIGEDNITIYAYLYNLLNHHFQEFEQEMTASFNQKNKPLF